MLDQDVFDHMIDGEERSASWPSSIPVVLLVEVATRRLLERASAAGVAKVVEKPLLGGVLAGGVRKAIDARDASSLTEDIPEVGRALPAAAAYVVLLKRPSRISASSDEAYQSHRALQFMGGFTMLTEIATAEPLRPHLHGSLPARTQAAPETLLPAGVPMSFRRNAEIFAEGEAAGYVYKVVSGVVRISKLLPDGRRQISAFHLPGDMFGFEIDDLHHCFCRGGRSRQGRRLQMAEPARAPALRPAWCASC